MGFLRNAIHHVVRQSVRFSSSTSSNKPSASAAFSVLLGQKKVVVNPGDIPLMTAFTLDILAKNRDRDVLMINSAKEVAMNVKKGVLGVIDARTYEEFSKGHISGAFVLPHDTPDERLERFMVLASKQGHEIFVIYCKERLQRSTTLAKRILELKPKHPLLMANLEVFLLEGALKNWVTKNELVNINMQAGFFS